MNTALVLCTTVAIRQVELYYCTSTVQCTSTTVLYCIHELLYTVQYPLQYMNPPFRDYLWIMMPCDTYSECSRHFCRDVRFSSCWPIHHSLWHVNLTSPPYTRIFLRHPGWQAFIYCILPWEGRCVAVELGYFEQSSISSQDSSLGNHVLYHRKCSLQYLCCDIPFRC